MIIPRFSLSQDDLYLYIKIRVPFNSSKKIHINIDKNMFSFNSTPYYLSLQLPGEINENKCKFEEPYAYDSVNGVYMFSYEKCISGQQYEDLEFITKFLVSKSERISQSHEELLKVGMDFRYGFGLQHYKPFFHKMYNSEKIFEIDPCRVNLSERKKMRLQCEQSNFDENVYLCSLEDEEIDEIIAQKSTYKEDHMFSDEELDLLKDLDNIDYNLNEDQVNYCFNSLIDILFAYCYDRRVSFYEDNCESDWNITNLAASISWLDVFNSPKEVLVACFRRSLIYPLYRQFHLSQTILSDVKDIISLGRIKIIKVLIEVYRILGRRHFSIINKIFIVDYIVYIMKWDKIKWQHFMDKTNAVVIKEEDLGLNLRVHECLSLNNLHISATDSDDESDYTSD